MFEPLCALSRYCKEAVPVFLLWILLGVVLSLLLHFRAVTFLHNWIFLGGVENEANDRSRRSASFRCTTSSRCHRTHDEQWQCEWCQRVWCQRVWWQPSLKRDTHCCCTHCRHTHNGYLCQTEVAIMGALKDAMKRVSHHRCPHT